MDTPRPTAVLYLRLSSSADQSSSIAMQEAAARQWCDAYGVTVSEVLADDGISGRVNRDNLDRAITMLRDGTVDVLVVNTFDRVSRAGVTGISNRLDAVESRESARFVAVQTGLDSNQPTWRLIAVVLAELARAEVQNTVARTKAGIAYKRLEQRRFTGGTPPMGYRSMPHPDGAGRALAIHPGERKLIERLVGYVLDTDRSLLSIVEELNLERVPTSRSAYRRAQHAGTPTEAVDDQRGVWHVTTLKSLLTGTALRGYMQHDGKLLQDDGVPVEVWPPIIDATTHERLLARLRHDRARLQHTPPRVRAARLLSGLAFCGECGAKMYVHTSHPKRGRAQSYTCTANAGPCPKPRMKAEHVERVVVEQYLAAVGHLPEVEAVEELDTTGLHSRITVVSHEVDSILAAMREPDADVPTLSSALQSRKGQLAKLQAEAPVGRTVAKPTGRTLADAWAAAEGDMVAQRAQLAVAIDHAAVHAWAGARKGYHPERVRVHWQPASDASALAHFND